MDVRKAVLPAVFALPAYQAGRPIDSVAEEFGLDPKSIVKLASNENPLGMSRAARAMLSAPPVEIARYPDPDCVGLRRDLAALLGLPAEAILVAAGSTELLSLVARSVLDETRSAVIPQYSFVVYTNVTRAAGARTIIVPAVDYGHDLEAMLRAIDTTTTVVFIASPNNPTGTMLYPADIERFLDQVPSDVLVVFDEAYRHYVSQDLQPAVTHWISRFPNLLVLRTFSKAYGLAGLRIGYAIGNPSLIEILRRLQAPFSVNALAQSAARASLADTEFLAESVALNRAELARVTAGLGDMDLVFVPSSANFVLVRVGDAPRVYGDLLRLGVIVRPVANYGLPEWLRISIGLPAENRAMLDGLNAILLEHVPRSAVRGRSPRSKSH